MSASQDQSSETAPRLKRSRNGCNECRRLHRRCDETKPACLNCVEAGKVCSYHRHLSWGGRPFGRSSFGAALGNGVVEIPSAETGDDASRGRSFVYGHAESSTSLSVPTLGRTATAQPRGASYSPMDILEDEPYQGAIGLYGDMLVSVPWLSQHHRNLLKHFIENTAALFAEDLETRQEVRSVLIPMAVDTNHGFSLLAALLSLASVHSLSLVLHGRVNESEYWQNMSVGHLRRPTVQEDESTQNVFVATALILCMRDTFDTEKPSAWRLHLQGALCVSALNFTRSGRHRTGTQRFLDRLARSMQIRSLLPGPLSPLAPVDSEAANDEVRGDLFDLPTELAIVLQHVRALRSERNALEKIEANSGSRNMSPLWSALRGRCLELIVRLKESGDLSVQTGLVSHQLYGHAALIQIYTAVLDLPTSDAGLRRTLEAAMTILRSLSIDIERHVGGDLLFPLFTVGCLARSGDDRAVITLLVKRIAEERGKVNAGLANAFLQELWKSADDRGRLVEHQDIDALTASKGWDLSLW